jgi:hypothetical protein
MEIHFSTREITFESELTNDNYITSIVENM